MEAVMASWCAQNFPGITCLMNGNNKYISPDNMPYSFNSLWPSDATWQHRSVSTLTQTMACCLTAASHYLNQCWLLFRGTCGIHPRLRIYIYIYICVYMYIWIYKTAIWIHKKEKQNKSNQPTEQINLWSTASHNTYMYAPPPFFFTIHVNWLYNVLGSIPVHKCNIMAWLRQQWQNIHRNMWASLWQFCHHCKTFCC